MNHPDFVSLFCEGRCSKLLPNTAEQATTEIQQTHCPCDAHKKMSCVSRLRSSSIKGLLKHDGAVTRIRYERNYFSWFWWFLGRATLISVAYQALSNNHGGCGCSYESVSYGYVRVASAAAEDWRRARYYLQNQLMLWV